MTQGRRSWAHEKPAHERGYDHRWRKLRARIMARDRGLCVACKEAGRLTAADEVDHIVPKARGGTDHPDQLQSLCRECHQSKTIRENGGRPRVEIAPDGWPVR